MDDFLMSTLAACQTGRITPEQFTSALKQRAVSDAELLRYLKKPEVFEILRRLCIEAGNDSRRAAAIARFDIEMTSRPVEDELDGLISRLLIDKAMTIHGDGEKELGRRGRVFWRGVNHNKNRCR